ncbi:MAG TPA: hypothetical protein VFH35_07900 [Ramlibacter sp.]|nr:hypothetical protein [Ramlibacter sp.]
MDKPENQPEASGKARGDTVPVQGEKQARSPRAPHERDESADSQAASEPSGTRIGTIAHGDMASGRVDTDKGPVLDATYDKLREGASQPVKQKRR